jgi:PAS domain S-box-containing protein
VWTLLPDGRVDYLNRRWLEYTGLSLERALENPTAALHPDDRDRAIEEWGERSARQEGYEAEMRLRRADGQYRWFLVRTVPSVDAEGRLFRWYGTCIDIEDRKRATETLRENQELLRTVLETLPVGVAVADAVGNILFNNAKSQEIWGGQPIASAAERMALSKGYWHGTDRRLSSADWASSRALSEGRPVRGQLVDIETYDGRHKTLHNSAAPIRNASGAVIGVVIVNQDMTEGIRAEEALLEFADRLQQLSRRLLTVQEEERRHLSRELHDEFGQLLSAISMHLEIAKGLSNPAVWRSLKECSALIELVVEGMRRLAIELRPPMLDAVGLDGTLRWLAEQYSRQGNVAVAVSVKGDLSDVPNEVAITCFRIVQESLTNVLRHAFAGKARIEIERGDASLRVLIEDDGMGFDVRAMRERAAGGRHLGFIGMRERAEILGGRLEIDSSPHAGTRIRVELPLRAEK